MEIEIGNSDINKPEYEPKEVAFFSKVYIRVGEECESVQRLLDKQLIDHARAEERLKKLHYVEDLPLNVTTKLREMGQNSPDLEKYLSLVKPKSSYDPQETARIIFSYGAISFSYREACRGVTISFEHKEWLKHQAKKISEVFPENVDIFLHKNSKNLRDSLLLKL